MSFWWIRYLAFGLAIALILYFAMIPVRLIGVKSRVPVPQAIFVLGGGSDREVAAAKLSSQHPELDVWISTGSPPEKVTEIFNEAGVPLSQLHLDYRAMDTVTNFTTMVGVFQQQDIEHIYLLTSDFHVRRARAIAFFVFGSYGIAYTFVEIPCIPANHVPSHCLPESTFHILRDATRSLFWLLLGETGAGLGVTLKTAMKKTNDINE